LRLAVALAIGLPLGLSGGRGVPAAARAAPLDPAAAGAAAPAALAARGRSLALSGAGTVPACATCHGAQGQGNAAIGAPALAGDGVAYLREQLANFTAGRRANPIMQPIAAGLSAAQRDAVAAFFAGLPSAPLHPAPLPTGPLHKGQAPADPLGVRLALRGAWSRSLPACTQCHGPGGIGVPPSFPHLAGLTAPYMIAQLEAFRSGGRPPGPLGLMGAVAAKLTPKEIAAVAAYFAASGGAPRPEAGR
jgi:cytochrome c553